MNKYFYRFIIIFSSLLMIVALLGAILIYIDNGSDLIVQSDSAADRIAADITLALNKGYTPETEEFKALSAAFFRKYPTLFSLSLYSRENGIYYLKTASHGIVKSELLDPLKWKGEIPYTDDAEGEIFQRRDLNLVNIPETLKIETGFGRSMTPANYKLSLTLFFIVAALLVFTIFALIFSDNGSRKIEEESEASQPPAHKPSATPGVKASTEPVPSAVTPPEPPADNPPPVPEPEIQEEKKSGYCIYSEITGFIKEDLLNDKLDQELIRSASFDQDLVLMIFSFLGLTSATAKEFIKIVNESFPYKDLVFDYKENSCAVIIPNTDIESSVAEIEGFQLKIEKAGFVENQKFCAGVSSRSGRLLKGDRLLLEASSSLKRAQSDKNGGILLFRISPRKYRQVVAQKGR